MFGKQPLPEGTKSDIMRLLTKQELSAQSSLKRLASAPQQYGNTSTPCTRLD
jgi:hypothetical protein